MSSVAISKSALSESGWTDGLPAVAETPAAIAACLGRVAVDADFDLGRGVTARMVALHTVRAGCKPEYMPVVLAAVEAVLDPQFHLEHLASPLSTWPAFVVNGPVSQAIGLYNGAYVMASFRHANATIGRAISLALANALPGLADNGQAVLGNAARMAGMVIAEKEDTPWEPLHVMLGHPRESSTVTAFSTFQGSPLQVLPLGSRYQTAPPVASLLAEQAAEGWCGPGTQMLLISPNAQRVFLQDGWSKEDLRSYLRQHAKISVAQLKRIRRWREQSGEATKAGPAAFEVKPGDEQRFFRLCDEELWRHVQPLFGEFPQRTEVDFLPVLAGSEVAHLYMYIFYPYPVPPPRPVTKTLRMVRP